MALAGFFAIFHGHADGTEMPVDAAGLAYGAGFALATALLRGAGLALGIGADHLAGAWSAKASRIAGGMVAAAGAPASWRGHSDPPLTLAGQSPTFGAL